MKTANVCKADDEIVRLCLRVKVRKATGRRVEGGSRIGRIEVLAGGACVFGMRNGRAGVPNAGEDEGIGSEVAILKRSGWRGVAVGSMMSRFQPKPSQFEPVERTYRLMKTKREEISTVSSKEQKHSFREFCQLPDMKSWRKQDA